MICPECKNEEAVQGLFDIYCPNEDCSNYRPEEGKKTSTKREETMTNYKRMAQKYYKKTGVSKGSIRPEDLIGKNNRLVMCSCTNDLLTNLIFFKSRYFSYDSDLPEDLEIVSIEADIEHPNTSIIYLRSWEFDETDGIDIPSVIIAYTIDYDTLEIKIEGFSY